MASNYAAIGNPCRLPPLRLSFSRAPAHCLSVTALFLATAAEKHQGADGIASADGKRRRVATGALCPIPRQGV
jgi:hypothetical protein